ncbi:NUDIX domain-containing protein [Streptomyces sp. NPDC057963]|uniref:NUDIX domain-containing protein n=1 Tax=Streptomyces sp. NPDC057963 TaxID=3346290 RepID=UPI0036E04068
MWACLFTPDGRVLVLLAPHTGVAILPGGTPEKQDQDDPVGTLRREAEEEAAARFGIPLHLGHVSDPAERRGYLRYAAALTSVDPARPDPATGHTYTRILATPEQAKDLFDWGPAAADQLAAVHQARRQLGLPQAAPQPVTQFSGPAAW